MRSARAVLGFMFCVPVVLLAGGGSIIGLKNDVKVCRQDTVCIVAKFGEKLQEGDSVVTGADSEVRIRLETGSIVKVGAAASFIIEVAEEGKNELKAKWGEFYFDTKGTDSKGGLKVKTPTAVAGTEGTRFTVTVDKGTGETRIELLSGVLRIVSLFAPQDSVTMPANHRIYARREAALTGPEPILDVEPGTGTGDDREGTGPGETGDDQPTEASAPTIELAPAVQQTTTERTYVEVQLGIDRLYESAQNASVDFVGQEPQVANDQTYVAPQPVKDKSKVIIEIR